MLRILVNALRTGVVTIRYPEVPSVPPERFRGAPVLSSGSHLPPPEVCPAGALSERLDAGRRHVTLDLARCVFCGRCAEDPWADAIVMGRDFELAARCRDLSIVSATADRNAVIVSGSGSTPSSRSSSLANRRYWRSTCGRVPVRP